MTARLIKKSWWVDFRVQHKRYRIRSPMNSRASALAFESVLRQKFARGESLESASKTIDQRKTFEQFAWQWFEEYAVPNNKYSEQHTKKYTLRAWLVPFFGKKLVADITTHDIEQYKAHALKRGVSKKTINNQLTIFRKCLMTAYDWLQLPGAPPKIQWFKYSSPPMDYLSPDECALLLSHTDGVIKEMILTALRTGMRQGELKGLQWSSIDWENRIIAVRHSYCDYSKSLTAPKSNRVRYIPMDVDLYELLLARKKETGFVFLDKDRQPFNSFRLGGQIARLRKRAGLRKIGWHTLRHTFASHLVMRGVPMTAVQMLMGHVMITTTMRYAHLAPSTLRSAIDMLNPKTMVGADFGQPVGNRWLEHQKQELVKQIRS